MVLYVKKKTVKDETKEPIFQFIVTFTILLGLSKSSHVFKTIWSIIYTFNII